MDYSRINSNLNAPEVAAEAKVSVVSLGGVQDYTVRAGMTVSEFKSVYGLNGTKIVNENGDTLTSDAIISRDMQVFVSTPKKNG